MVENDVKVAEDIWGKDAAALKGRTTRQTAEMFADDAVETHHRH